MPTHPPLLQAPRSRWRRLARALGWALLLAILGIGAAALLALQGQASLPAPSIQAAGAAPPWAQARGWLAQLRMNSGSGGLRRVVLRQADVNGLLEQLATSPGRPVRAQVAFLADRAELQASWPLSRWPSQPWLNLQLAFDLRAVAPGLLPPLAQARVGRLPLPPSWVQWAVERTLDREVGPSWRRLPGLLQAAHSRPQTLLLVLQLERHDLAQAVSGLFSPAEREALQAQATAWQAVVQAGGPLGRSLSVAEALRGGAVVALARVQQSGADPGTELHALLLHLGLHATGRRTERLLAPAAAPNQEPAPAPPLVLVLGQRPDMAQHFLLSALLTWQGGQRFSNALGLGKELSDARGGSGFSFNDLAGDLAGTRFGQLAQAEPARLLGALAAGLAEPAFFPEVADLPEFLPEAALRQRFGGVGAPAYEAQLADIRRRVTALPLHVPR